MTAFRMTKSEWRRSRRKTEKEKKMKQDSCGSHAMWVLAYILWLSKVLYKLYVPIWRWPCMCACAFTYRAQKPIHSCWGDGDEHLSNKIPDGSLTIELRFVGMCVHRKKVSHVLWWRCCYSSQSHTHTCAPQRSMPSHLIALCHVWIFQRETNVIVHDTRHVSFSVLTDS